MRSTLVVALTVAALSLAGCTGGGPGDGFTTPVQDAEGRYVIELTGQFRFEPRNAAVPIGATVVWVNNAGSHTVTSYSDAFDSGPLGAGEEFEQTFDSAGDHPYFCGPHEGQGMTATLRVE